jgi:hypothetical protein
MGVAANEPSYPSLELIYELTVAQLQRQLARIDALDAKLATLVGFSGVLLALIFSADFLTEGRNPVMSAAAALLLAALVLLLIALRVGATSFDPDVRALRVQYPNRPIEETRFDIIDNVIGAIDANEDKLRWKAGRAELAWVRGSN